MEAFLGTSPGVYLVVAVVCGGGCAYMTGQALATTWRPMWMIVPYALLLGLAVRFLIYALFDGVLLTAVGYLVDAATMLIVALLSYKVARARMMVIQYPWLYRRSGLFGWKEIN